MSQAIGNIVYGIRCTDAMREKAKELGLIDLGSQYFPRASYEALGFTVAYHPYGDQPIWCGVVLDTVWDLNDVRFNSIKHESTEAQQEFVRGLIAALPEALREMAGEPDVWFIWAGG